MRILRSLLAHSRTNPRTLVAVSVLTGLATMMVLAVVNTAAGAAAEGQVSLRLLALVAMGTVMFAVGQTAVTRITAHETERMIFRMRMALFEDVRRANLTELDAIGRAPLHEALTRNMQGISRNLPMVAFGLQTFTMLVCVGVYLLVLSPVAFALAAVFATLAVVLHLSRMAPVRTGLRAAGSNDNQLFDGLQDMLLGFKSVRMSRARAAGLRAELATLSDGQRETKTALKRAWGFEVAMVQLMFYSLVGLMVFVVPLFTQDYNEVVVKATTTVLFMIGPIGTVIQAVPALTNAEAALADIDEKRVMLGSRLATQTDEAAEPIDGPLREVALRDVRFSYRAAASGGEGRPGFSVGPLSATLRSGELTFVTGGNGSGKSTMLLLLTALRPADGGQILVNGAPLRPGQMQAYRDSISAIFGDYHLFQTLYGVDPADADARAPALLERLDMADKVAVHDGAFTTIDLSQGQRKRLALVMAELEDKPFLVLDEWAADQDPHFRAIFYERILPELRARGKIVLCVTHDDRWFHMADRILHMEEGRLREATPPAVPS